MVLGTFHNCDRRTRPARDEIVDEILGRLGVPVVSGFDAGHYSGGAVLPMGCQVRVDADAGTVELLEPVLGNRAPVRRHARRRVPRPRCVAAPAASR